MSAAAWAAVFGGLTLLSTLFGVVFLGGKLASRVDEHGMELDRHGKWLEQHDSTLTRHAEQLAEGKGFRDGMKVGQSHVK